MKSKWQFVIILFALTPILQCHKNSNSPNPIISTDLSFTKNPNAPWQIGYSLTSSLDSDQFQFCTSADTSDIIGMWHPTSDQSGYYPYLGQNRAKLSKVSKTNGWAVRAGQIAMEASNTGQYSLLRFIVPVSANYKVKVIFEGVHFGLSTTDVHVLYNRNNLFDDFINGYGGDSAYHKIEGSHPSATFENTIHLKKGDILTFCIGYGANKNHYSDTTGLMIFIEIV